MSFLLTQNAELLLRKLILLDMNDVPYNRRQLLSSYCGMKLFLIKQLTQGCPSTRDKSYLMKYILRRITANMPASLYQYALTLVSTGQCATVMVHLNRAIIRGHLPSRALKAWLLIDGREGVAQDWNGAFELVEEGARLGCHHCQGVMARCCRWAMVSEEMKRDRWSWRARAQGRAADTGSTSSARFFGVVKESLRRIAPKLLRCFGWLLRRTLIGRSAAWA